jgi:hypothetical protein
VTENDPGAGDQIGTTGAPRVLVDTAIDVAAALAGAAVPSLAPWLAGGATFVKAMGPRLNEHQDKNLDILMLEARASSGMEFEDFASTIENDPERMLHFVAACDAARRTALDEKIKALGRAVGDLARDAALIDESAIWIDIFSQVDAAHVRVVLAFFGEDAAEHREWRYAYTRTTSDLQQLVGMSSAISVLVNTLSSLGILEEQLKEESELGGMRLGFSIKGSHTPPRYSTGPLAAEFLNRLQN